MQEQQGSPELLYGLFRSICGWAFESGYRDINEVKNLAKLAMIDVCKQKHASKGIFAQQMGIVTDLGISIRNVQKSLKDLDEIKDLLGGFVKVREVQKEIAILLNEAPRTTEELTYELSYLIRAPYDLQIRTMKAILQEMVQKGLITETNKDGESRFNACNAFIDLFNPADLTARVMGVKTMINAYKHSLTEPLLEVYHLTPQAAEKLQFEIQDFIMNLGDSTEAANSSATEETDPYYFYLGSFEQQTVKAPDNALDAIIECIQVRFTESEQPSCAQVFWFQLTEDQSLDVSDKVEEFIRERCRVYHRQDLRSNSQPYVFYFGLAEYHASLISEEI
ncbi:MAG: hypothetical protein ABIE92_13355 [bacterium]